MIFGCINDEVLNQHVLNAYKSVCHFKPDYNGIDICSCLCILLFVISQHKRWANESWFQNKIDEWCKNEFIPLIDNKSDSWLRLWQNVL